VPARLTIVGTNDLHGWIQRHEAKLPEATIVTSGGLAVFAAYVERLRGQNPGGVVLVDAGDLFQGTLASNLSEGEVVVDAYNALGYDAAAIGNHEFDYGPVGPRSAAVDPADEPFGALRARIAQAKFPFLGRNIYEAGKGARPSWFGNDGTAMVTRKGLRIGVVGLTTPMTPQVTNPVNVRSLEFKPLATEAAAAAAELREKGADIVVAAVHAGGKCASLDDPHSLTGCEDPSEIFDMLNALPEGTLDVVVAGHTHAEIGHFVRGTPVIESGCYGRRFGYVELSVDPGTRRPVPSATRIRAALPICETVLEKTGDCDTRRWRPGTRIAAAHFEGTPIVPRKAIDDLITPYIARVRDEQKRLLGVFVPAPLGRHGRRESALGDAVADAVRAMEETDVVLLNSGGFRADLASGPMTYGDLYEVLPFDNTVATLTLTGQEIIDLLEALLNSEHGVPQTSGVRFVVAECGRESWVETIVFSDGRPFDRAATYKLTTIDFLALGGDGLGRELRRIPPIRMDLATAACSTCGIRSRPSSPRREGLSPRRSMGE
jgi:5'-nucleotidase